MRATCTHRLSLINLTFNREMVIVVGILSLIIKDLKGIVEVCDLYINEFHINENLIYLQLYLITFTLLLSTILSV